MKKLAFGFACFLVGCAAGAVMPRVTAQTFAANPSAPRWQQTCEHVPNQRADSVGIDRLDRLVVARGAEGWELAGVFAPTNGSIGVCFKRPAP